MNHKIDLKEQYAVISLSEGHLTDEIAKQLETAARELLREEYSNLILVMDQATALDTEAVLTLRKLVQLCKIKLGILIVATASDDFTDILEDSNIADLLVLPTLEEAVDAVFMHDLENQFGTGDDDDYDDDDYAGISEMKEP